MRVKYLFNRKKSQALIDEIRRMAHETVLPNEPFEISELCWEDLSENPDLVADFDILVQKVTDLMGINTFMTELDKPNSSKALPDAEREPTSQQAENAELKLNLLNRFIQNNPKLIIMDPLDNLYNILSRSKTLDMLTKLISNLDLSDIFRVIGFDTISSINEISDNSWIIVKSDLACSTLFSHEMTIVSPRIGLSELKSMFPPNHITQPLLPHWGILIKVYALEKGNEIWIDYRPSISDKLWQSDLNVFKFNSQKIPKSFCEHGSDSINDPGEIFDTRYPQLDERFRVTSFIESKIDHIKQISRKISCSFGFSFFGFDMIMTKTGLVQIIDLNYFPGFKGTNGL